MRGLSTWIPSRNYWSKVTLVKLVKGLQRPDILQKDKRNQSPQKLNSHSVVTTNSLKKDKFRHQKSIKISTLFHSSMMFVRWEHTLPPKWTLIKLCQPCQSPWSLKNHKLSRPWHSSTAPGNSIWVCQHALWPNHRLGMWMIRWQREGSSRLNSTRKFKLTVNSS